MEREGIGRIPRNPHPRRGLPAPRGRPSAWRGIPEYAFGDHWPARRPDSAADFRGISGHSCDGGTPAAVLRHTAVRRP